MEYNHGRHATPHTKKGLYMRAKPLLLMDEMYHELCILCIAFAMYLK